ncbi:MAG: hypothetical protein ACYCUF_02460 [Acidimicrobiales bacterium]|nr:hypothetical protein [Actinomycetota bacterium]MDA8184207.1 hypothetical protein [Actinomycetota bacterium]
MTATVRPREAATEVVALGELAPGLVAVLWRAPWLVPSAFVQAMRLAPRRWWTRWPPIPLPTRELWDFRIETAYGPPGGGQSASLQVPPADLREHLEWCRSMRSWTRK